jgi:hypothetical protein
MDLDEPAAAPSLNITRTIGSNLPSTSKVSDVIRNFRPTKLFARDDIKEGKPTPRVLSIDFDDPGELCMTSESDETIQIYNVKEGVHNKTLLSKKYGVKLAKFTHTHSAIIYASTKQNGEISRTTPSEPGLICQQTPSGTSRRTTTASFAILTATRALLPVFPCTQGMTFSSLAVSTTPFGFGIPAQGNGLRS